MSVLTRFWRGEAIDAAYGPFRSHVFVGKRLRVIDLRLGHRSFRIEWIKGRLLRRFLRTRRAAG